MGSIPFFVFLCFCLIYNNKGRKAPTDKGTNMAKITMNEIRSMFAERLNLESVDESKGLKDLGLDSLDVVEMCLDLEDKANIQFNNEELASFKTVGDLFKAIEKKIG